MYYQMRSRVAVVALLSSIFFASAALADDTAMRQFVSRSTNFVARIDVPALKLDGLDAWTERTDKQLGADDEAVRQTAAVVAAYVKKVKVWREQFINAGGRRIYFVSSSAGPGDSLAFAAVPLERDAESEKIIAALESLRDTPVAAWVGEPESLRCQKIGQAVVWANRDALPEVATIVPVERPDVAAALTEAGDLPIIAALVPPPGQKRQLDVSFLRTLLGGIQLDELAEKVQWVSAGLRPPPGGALKVITRTDPKTAKTLHDRASARIAEELGRDPAAARFIQMALPKVQGDRLVTTLDAKELDELVVEYARAMQLETSRMQAASQPAAR